MPPRLAHFSAWFADRILFGRVLAGLGGYLGANLFFGAFDTHFALLGILDCVCVIACIAMLAPVQRGLGGLGLCVVGAVAWVSLGIFPFGPALLLGAGAVLGTLSMIARSAAPARNAHILPRVAALSVVLATTSATLGFAAYEAWVLWPEAFSLELSGAEAYELLDAAELHSVRYSAGVWAVATLVATLGFVGLVVFPRTRMGVRRILSLGFALAAAGLVNLRIWSSPVARNLTDYGSFATEEYRWGELTWLAQVLLFTAAFLVAAIRMPDEVRAPEPAPAEEPTAQPG